MSKMSNIAMQLDEKAVELGFADHLEALGNGYEWGVGQDGEAFLFKPEDEQGKAHEAWLEDRDALLRSLYEVHARAIDEERLADASIIKNTIEFIEGVKSE